MRFCNPCRSALPALIMTVTGFCICTDASADGLLCKLPPDGGYAVYDVSIKFSRDGQEQKIEGELKVSSVGKTQDGGKDARWIEVRGERKDQQDQVVLMKVLAPEESFKVGEDVQSNIIRGWVKRGDNDPRQFGANDEEFTRLFALLLGGPLDSPKKLEKKEIEVEGLGKLSCERESGTREVMMGPDRTVRFKNEIWRNVKAPFGSVKMLTTGKYDQDGAETLLHMETTLVIVGEDAESELPDLN